MQRKTHSTFRAVLALLGAVGTGMAHAQVSPQAGAPSANTTARMQVARYDKSEFNRQPKATLQTWQVTGGGVGLIEAQVWYITGGKAILRDYRILGWSAREPGVSGRLQLLEQPLANKNFLSSFSVGSAFYSGPTVSTDSITAPAPVRLPSPFFVFYHVTTSHDPGIPSGRPVVLYLAQTEKGVPRLRKNPALKLITAQEPKPLEALTRLSRQPGTAFVAFTVQWTPTIAPHPAAVAAPAASAK